MKKVEKLLNQPPLSQPSQELDQKAEVLFDQALANSQQHWFAIRVPAWGALAACIACLFIGRLWVPEPVISESMTKQEVITPSEPEPDVFVQVTRHAFAQESSPFIREKKTTSNRFSTTWTVSQ
jgi:hypothetical protein